MASTINHRKHNLDDCADIIFNLLRRRRIIEVELVTVNRQTLDNLLERKIFRAWRRERNGEPVVDKVDDETVSNVNARWVVYLRYESPCPVWIPKSKPPNNRGAPIVPKHHLISLSKNLQDVCELTAFWTPRRSNRAARSALRDLVE